MIEIKNLYFGYNLRQQIFSDVSLTLESGICGLLGENGVGKTTLLHIISGLRFPGTGTCKIFGEDSAKRLPETLSKIFFLPEEFETPPMSIKEFAKFNSVFYPNFSKTQFDAYLTEFQVDKSKKMTEQSLGQKKKAMIAFALALGTEILLLDEPTNGLDIPSKSQFRKILAEISAEDRLIVISSHQVRDLDNLIDPIIILDHNAVLLNNSIEEISNKLYFSYGFDKTENAIYSEQNVAGFTSVALNEYNKESAVNIEVLFNAVINNKAKIKEIFNP